MNWASGPLWWMADLLVQYQLLNFYSHRNSGRNVCGKAVGEVADDHVNWQLNICTPEVSSILSVLDKWVAGTCKHAHWDKICFVRLGKRSSFLHGIRITPHFILLRDCNLSINIVINIQKLCMQHNNPLTLKRPGYLKKNLEFYKDL